MTAELTELAAVAAVLPPDKVRQVIAYAQLLSQPSPAEYDTDEPAEDELGEESNRMMQRFEDEHPGEDWSQQPYTPGYK